MTAWTQRRLLTAMLGIAALALVPTSAGADGLPVPVEDTGPTGIAEPDGAYRYISTDIGADTLVQRTVQNGGQVSKSRIIDGTVTIPAVAVDGSPSGLSGDGETLVMIRPRPRPGFPRASTRFVVLHTERLRVTDTVRLDGDFSFDAISPDGRWMYLIEYVSPRNLTRYQVRRYDLERGRLDPKPIIDPNVAHEVMAGLPLARETDSEGRWAYTLYGNYRPDAPFIHALDTQRGEALCIELSGLEGTRDLYALGLEPGSGGSGLVVTSRGSPVALVDTETYEVTEPPPETPSGEVTEDGAADDDGMPWALAAGALALVGALAVTAVRRRRRRQALPPDPFAEAEVKAPVAPGAGARE
jgi:hypothetical protein